MFPPSPGNLNAVLHVADAAADKTATNNAAVNNAATNKSNPYRQMLTWLLQLCSVLSRAHKPFHSALALAKDTR